MNPTTLRAAANMARLYSPVVMSSEWSKLGRLLFMLISSGLGVFVNGFFVASFFVEPYLKKVGYVFMACCGMSDFFISAIVTPTSAVVLLSGEWDTEPVCRALQFVSQASTYSYSIFFMMSAIESYYRLCKATCDYKRLVSMKIGVITVLLFAMCFLTAAAGVYLNLDYDYCNRSHTGNFIFRITTSIVFYVVPFIVIFFCLLNNSCRIKDKAKKHNHYRRSLLYETETIENNLSFTSYLMYVIAWTPYVITVYIYPYTSDSKYYICAWLGLFRSVVTAGLYGFMDKNFRKAYTHLYYYCFCKSTLSGAFTSRHRRGLEGKSLGEVRVHIMHQAVNVNSPQRGASSSRETQEL